MASLTLGTKEYVLIDVVDDLGQLDTLDTADAQFQVKNDLDDIMIAWTGVDANVGLTAYCMIDTTTPVDAWIGGTHRLYLKFDAFPEVPELGPFYFNVDDS